MVSILVVQILHLLKSVLVISWIAQGEAVAAAACTAAVNVGGSFSIEVTRDLGGEPATFACRLTCASPIL